MPELIVSNIEDVVQDRLRRRAERHGRSMDEEVRDILRAAATTEDAAPLPLGSRISARFAGLGLDESLPELRGQPARAARLEP